MPITRTALVVGTVLFAGLAATLYLTASEPRIADAVEGGLPPIAAPAATLGDADGYIETGGSVSPFADELPAIAKLEPGLRTAMQHAARAAIADGVEFVVTSGWRSAEYQRALLAAAVVEYGSADAAGEFVLPPDRSKHVSGEAVDIGRTDANSWLSQHGADYGLCQMYANEMWHFELATSPGGECPPQLSHAGAS